MAVGASEVDVVRAHEVGCSNNEHNFGWKVLEYAVDGIEVSQILFS